MSMRRRALSAALWLALLFVLGRVLYRLVFHGMDGTGRVLLPLPVFRLPTPFSHITVLGPVTADGLINTVIGALPFALLICVTGVLLALLNLPRLWARGTRYPGIGTLSRILLLAWATLPALVESTRAVRMGMYLRQERSGLRMLTPVLERTLARATELSAALEVRGMGRKPVATSGSTAEATPGTPMEPLLQMHGLVLSHRDGRALPITVPDEEFYPGELILVQGPTGSGKTSVLRAMAGLHTYHDGGTLAGQLLVGGLDRTTTVPRDTAGVIGYVNQRPREGFVVELVRDEVAATLEFRRADPVFIAERISTVCKHLKISTLLDRPVTQLSAGEAVLVAIAGAVVDHPQILLVDEPLADLDEAARARVIETLQVLAHQDGLCVLVAEHRLAELRAVCDRTIILTGALAGGSAPDAVETADRNEPVSPAVHEKSAWSPPSDVVLELSHFQVFVGEHSLVNDASLTLHAGEILAVYGPNGAGKSSLFQGISTAAAIKPPRGRQQLKTSGALAASGTLRLVPDNSDDLLMLDSVQAECDRADRRAHVVRGTTLAQWEKWVGAGDQRLRVTHPRDLSQGQRRCLALAIQLAAKPAILLVDEPTRGLDPAAVQAVAAALVDSSRTGCAVLIATHDLEFAQQIAGGIHLMNQGGLGPRQAVIRRVAGPVGSAPALLPQEHTSVRDRLVAGSIENRITPRSELPRPELRRAELRRAKPPRIRFETPAGMHGSGPGKLPEMLRRVGLALAHVLALSAFTWPLLATALPEQSTAAAPILALALIPLAVILLMVSSDGTIRAGYLIALLASLAAVGAALRIGTGGVGGIEAVFLILILGGRAYGAQFGLLLGVLTLLFSAAVTGGVGPWLPFQMFAAAWVGAGAGLLPRFVRGRWELLLLMLYGAGAAYLFGLLMNLWFWPFAVGAGTGISYDPGAPFVENASRFLLYSLVTSTLTWDTLRAITIVVGIALIGRPVLGALRRVRPLQGLPGTTRLNREVLGFWVVKDKGIG